jgi:hypothetical protein
VYIILTTAITILPMIAKPVETSIGMGMILTALPVYWVFISWKSKPAWSQIYKVVSSSTMILIQNKLECLSLPSLFIF